MVYRTRRAGGLIAKQRRIRYEAGERSARGEKTAVALGICGCANGRWNAGGVPGGAGGMDALASTGPAKVPKLSDGQASCRRSWPWDRRAWLGRPAVGPKLRIDCSSAGVWRLIRRHGWSWQWLAQRALERDEHAVELWNRDV